MKALPKSLFFLLALTALTTACEKKTDKTTTETTVLSSDSTLATDETMATDSITTLGTADTLKK